MMQIKSLSTPFKSYFSAESYLEIQGYQCRKNIWQDDNNNFATVVAKGGGVYVELINKKEKTRDF